MRGSSWKKAICLAVAAFLVEVVAFSLSPDDGIGREVAIPRHLANGEEFTTPLNQLIRFGARLFTAQFTVQEGAGRPCFYAGKLRAPQQAPVSAPLSRRPTGRARAYRNVLLCLGNECTKYLL